MNKTLSGIILAADTLLRSGRTYPKAIVETAVAEYMRRQPDYRYGELFSGVIEGDASTIVLDQISHKVLDITFDGELVRATVEIADTPHGKVVNDRLNEQAPDAMPMFGLSLRGIGKLTDGVVTGYRIVSVALVPYMDSFEYEWQKKSAEK